MLIGYPIFRHRGNRVESCPQSPSSAFVLFGIRGRGGSAISYTKGKDQDTKCRSCRSKDVCAVPRNSPVYLTSIRLTDEADFVNLLNL